MTLWILETSKVRDDDNKMIGAIRKLWDRLLGVKVEEVQLEPEIVEVLQEEASTIIISDPIDLVVSPPPPRERSRSVPVRVPDPNNIKFWAEQLGARMASFYPTADASNPPQFFNNWSDSLEYLLYYLERGRRFA